MPTPTSEQPRPHPPAGKQFPCLQCGARLDYDPGRRGLKCPYCGYEQQVDSGDREVREHDLEKYLADGKGKTRVQGRTSEVQCGTCGAVVLLEDKVVTETCPYCSSHLTNQPHQAEDMIPPEAIVPFTVDREAALAAFHAWLKSLWFAPKELNQVTIHGQCHGVYLPFWTFDAMTCTRYTAERGDNYQDSETYTETEHYTDSQGQAQSRPVTKTRTVTRTRWSRVTGEIDHFFDDVLIPATESLPAEYAATFGVDALAQAVPFQAEYLASFVTERYTVGPRDGYKAAQAVMEATIRNLIAQDVGGDHQRISTLQTHHVGVTFKQVLLPLYLASYKYRDKTYRVMVNGLTGEVIGDRPYAWQKIVSLILVILVAILSIIAVVMLLTR